MARPGFLKNPMPPAPVKPRGPIRSGSFMLELQPAPWRYTLSHDREDTTLLWITKGQGRVMINGVLRGVSMHNALFLPAGTLFAIDLPVSAQALFVHAPAGLAPREPGEPLVLRIRDSFAQAELTGEIDTLSREAMMKRTLLQEALEARVKLLGIWLFRQIEAGATESQPDTAAQRLARRYAQAVTRGFRSPRPMAEFAEELDVTPTHLSRACRQCCGKTAAELLTERKLHAARVALESPKPAVQEVARTLGFASPAYFSRFIQSHTGLSPTALRAQARKTLSTQAS